MSRVISRESQLRYTRLPIATGYLRQVDAWDDLEPAEPAYQEMKKKKKKKETTYRVEGNELIMEETTEHELTQLIQEVVDGFTGELDNRQTREVMKQAIDSVIRDYCKDLEEQDPVATTCDITIL